MMQVFIAVGLIALLILVSLWLGARAEVAELQHSVKALKRRLSQRR